MDMKTPELYEYFERWDKSKDDRKPLVVELWLAHNGRWEAAWSLAQLHVDQIMKKEVTTKKRISHKGHPLCNVALLGQKLGAPALVRHYAQLSSAGDYYRDGPGKQVAQGLAPVLMEAHESRKRHDEWREYVGDQMALIDGTGTRPLFLEAYLAARWFRGKYRELIVGKALMNPLSPQSFVDVLLDEVANWKNSNTTMQGTLFEAAAGLLLSATPGFTVYPCRWNKDDQIDLVVRYEADSLAAPCLPQGYGLVECKAEKKEVNSATLRDFGMKCLLHKVQFGILVAQAGIKGSRVVFQDLTGAELVRRRFLSDGLSLLVLDINHLIRYKQELRGLHDALFDDYQELVFGRIVGEE
jgi:hypothetical protein